MPHPKGPPRDADELFPVEPPEPDEGPEPDPSPLDELEDAPQVEDPLGPLEDEDMLPPDGDDAVAEDDRWWAPEAGDEPLLPEPTDDGTQEISPVADDEEEPVDWDALEDEAHMAPLSLARLGWRERLSLPGGAQLVALCDPTAARSSLSATLEPVGEGLVRVSVGETSHLVPGAAEPHPTAALTLSVQGLLFTAEVAVVAPGQEPPLRLGRDALAGRALVDPSRDGAP